MSIHQVVYEVEDIIDAFVARLTEKGHKGLFPKFWSNSINLDSICRKVEEVKEMVGRARADIGTLSLHHEGKDEYIEVRPPRVKDVVGFKEVTDGLIGRLTKETDYFDVVSLTGVFGLGKTTLAWKIFNDPEVQFKFPVRIWLPISQQFSDKDIFLSILKEFTTLTDDIRQKDYLEISRIVVSFLERVSFLIIFDDVWSTADWDRIRIALPDMTYTKGKVLITSREKDVGNYASAPRPAEELRFFNQAESWELLRLEALRTLDCPLELENVGQVIARECDGLPLAVVVIGGILAAKYSASDMHTTLKAWRKVSERVNTYLSEDDTAGRIKKFISLTYDRLPYYLRACFLYLGLFPDDYEIRVSRLIRLWIGEGFIQQSHDCTLEETAERYLKDLISRNLVQGVKYKPDGKVKTCRVHETIRSFCCNEAASENFLQEIKYEEGQFAPSASNIDKYRRLSIHSNCINFMSLKPFGPRVHSFVSSAKDEFVVPPENSSNIIRAFKMLRVLDVVPFKFTKIENDLYNLVHMRYIALSSDLSSLPSKFSQLWNIQTLVVNTTSRTLVVKADIWKMNQLRHFKTNASATLPKPSAGSIHGAELQTLSTISVESCTAELFVRTCNLKKLGIRGKLATLLEGKVGSIDSLGEMKHLEKLKLINDVHPKPLVEGKLLRLPKPQQFPSALTSLTLCATFLGWNDMSTLGLLKKLKSLKLKENAFMGSTWEAQDGGFECLEFLLIEETDLTFWEASSHHFPRLRGLVLKNCEKLREIPIGFADIPYLQMLELYSCKSATTSARSIRDAKQKAHAEGGSAFELSVFPPIG